MSCCDSLRSGEHHCARCHNSFGSLEQFDRHQDVDYRRRPAVLCAAVGGLGLIQDGRGTWQTPEGLKARLQSRARLETVRHG